MERITMKVGGMSCGHCVAAVARALGSVEGVEVEQVGIGTATVSYDPNLASPERITAALQEEGYVAAQLATP